MAYTASEQELYDFARGALPGWLFAHERAEEVMEALVKMFDRVLSNIGESRLRRLICESTSIWLEIHAADRGTYRQNGETDEALIIRIKNVEDAVTRPALIAAAQAIVDSVPIPTSIAEFFEDPSGTPSGAEIGDGSHTGLEPDEITVEAWAYVNSYGPFNTGVIVDKYGTPANASYQMALRGGGNQIGVKLYVGGASRTMNFATGGIPIEEWHHIAFTREQSTGETKAFLDGVQVDATQTNSVGDAIDNSTKPFRLGGGSIHTEDFEGYLSDVRVWSVCRTPAEIAASYQQRLEGNEVGLVGYWPLHTDFTDYTANGNDLTAVAGTSGTDAPEIVTDVEPPVVGTNGTVFAVELKRDKGFFGSYEARTGSDGTFVDTGADDIWEFTPTVAFDPPVEIFERSGAQGNPRITFSAHPLGDNEGTFEIIGLNGSAIQYVDPTAIAEVDAEIEWALHKYDVEGNDREGRKRAYFGRGYRMSANLPLHGIIILPYGCSAGIQASVEEMLRQKKAFGVVTTVECRANP